MAESEPWVAQEKKLKAVEKLTALNLYSWNILF